MMLKSFRSTEASSGEALNGDEICSLGPSPLEDVVFELIGFQWTRRFLLIERFDCYAAGCSNEEAGEQKQY